MPPPSTTRQAPFARRRRPAQPRLRGAATRERILDAAEELFARRGYHGVSIRDITRDAGVDVALVNYHFGTKEALLDSVLTRRSEVLNAERMALLQACMDRARSGAPALADVIAGRSTQSPSVRGFVRKWRARKDSNL